MDVNWIPYHAIDGDLNTLYSMDCESLRGRPDDIGWCWFQLDFKYEWNVESIQFDMRESLKDRFTNIEVRKKMPISNS